MPITCKVEAKKPLSHRVILQPVSSEDKKLADNLPMKEEVVILTATEYKNLKNSISK
jgi:hypothetical protein